MLIVTFKLSGYGGIPKPKSKAKEVVKGPSIVKLFSKIFSPSLVKGASSTTNNLSNSADPMISKAYDAYLSPKIRYYK